MSMAEYRPTQIYKKYTLYNGNYNRRHNKCEKQSQDKTQDYKPKHFLRKFFKKHNTPPRYQICQCIFALDLIYSVQYLYDTVILSNFL